LVRSTTCVFWLELPLVAPRVKLRPDALQVPSEVVASADAPAAAVAVELAAGLVLEFVAAVAFAVDEASVELPDEQPATARLAARTPIAAAVAVLSRIGFPLVIRAS
jgi:hypothetical protein